MNIHPRKCGKWSISKSRWWGWFTSAAWILDGGSLKQGCFDQVGPSYWGSNLTQNKGDWTKMMQLHLKHTIYLFLLAKSSYLCGRIHRSYWDTLHWICNFWLVHPKASHPLLELVRAWSFVLGCMTLPLTVFDVSTSTHKSFRIESEITTTCWFNRAQYITVRAFFSFCFAAVQLSFHS